MDPFEFNKPAILNDFKTSLELPFPVYMGNREMFVAYNVTVRSTKLAVGSNGVITFREGYGLMSTQDWDQVLADLVQS
ncbi:MAG: hypothetical protein C1O27_001729 [Chloroflexi bacterium]|jgi:hypothetical protein|nr:MAG: hypothetical protein C1O27_001729 [Chloroflexota bacterium]